MKLKPVYPREGMGVAGSSQLGAGPVWLLLRALPSLSTWGTGTFLRTLSGRPYPRQNGMPECRLSRLDLIRECAGVCVCVRVHCGNPHTPPHRSCLEWILLTCFIQEANKQANKGTGG